MAVSFRECTLEDLEILQAFSRRLFFETFADMNTPENMAVYLDKAFAAEKIRAELSDENSVFYFLYRGGKLAGYLKLNEAQPRRISMMNSRWKSRESMCPKNFKGRA